MRLLPAVRAFLAVVLGAAAGLAFGPAFGGDPAPAPLVLAITAVCAVAGVISVAAALFARLPAVAVALAGTLGTLVAAMASTGVYSGLQHGPMRLLTGALPAEAAGPVLAAVTLLIGWSALAAGLLAAYAPNPLAPLAPALACLLIALGLGSGGRPLPDWYPVILVVLVAGLLFTGHSAARSPGAIAAAAVLAAAGVASAFLLGPTVPGLDDRPPADLRSLVAAPVQPRSGVSPLQQYLALRNGIRPFKLTGHVSRPGSLLRMATLTGFDGGYWTVTGDYRRAGTQLAEPRRQSETVTVTQRIEVAAGQLDWVVTAGRATTVSVPGLGFDRATGDIAVPLDTTPPAAYSATSSVSQASLTEILAAEPAPTREPLPTLPPQLASFLDTATSGAPPGADQLLALYQRFTTDSRFKYDESADAPGGHGYFHLQRLLETGRGTSEQYASAYAVMARRLGFDARVVMGLRPRYEQDSSGRFTAQGQDVDAWVEVNFADLGWISVDPSPRDRPEGTRPGQAAAPSRSSGIDDQLNETAQPSQPLPPDGEDLLGAQSPAAPAFARSTLLTLVGAGVAVLLILASFPPAAKAARRSRRRRSPSTRAAVVGAWRESLDRLQEAGMPVNATQSTGDVVRRASRDKPTAATALATLAELADRAAYAPDAPDPALRAHAWRAAAQVRRAVARQLPFLRRWRARLDPRPLTRRHR